ncbi:MAG: hypothetical protein LBU32_33220 [Clostridiales bacterium]|jgi:hypothetical protein|nr:hypothetical protein [Clostridiales bacterium]
MAAEIHPDPAVREGLVKRGYISGKDAKEPAVKTLNSIAADRQRTMPALVYENNREPVICEDEETLDLRKENCGVRG